MFPRHFVGFKIGRRRWRQTEAQFVPEPDDSWAVEPEAFEALITSKGFDVSANGSVFNDEELELLFEAEREVGRFLTFAELADLAARAGDDDDDEPGDEEIERAAREYFRRKYGW